MQSPVGICQYLIINPPFLLLHPCQASIYATTTQTPLLKSPLAKHCSCETCWRFFISLYSAKYLMPPPLALPVAVMWPGKGNLSKEVFILALSLEVMVGEEWRQKQEAASPIESAVGRHECWYLLASSVQTSAHGPVLSTLIVSLLTSVNPPGNAFHKHAHWSHVKVVVTGPGNLFF